MVDAWEELIGGSTIETGDAWEHLLAQGGEGGSGETVLIGTVLTAESNWTSTAEILDISLSSNVLESYSAHVDIETLTAHIEQTLTAE